LAGSAGNTPVGRFRFILCTDLQQATGSLPLMDLCKQWWREWESHPPEEVYEASLCALVEFPATKWWRPAGNAPAWSCLQGRRLTYRPRPHRKLASRPGAAPGKLSFGDSAARAGARLIWKLVRLPGIAPGHAPWREAILLLNHNRGN